MNVHICFYFYIKYCIYNYNMGDIAGGGAAAAAFDGILQDKSLNKYKYTAALINGYKQDSFGNLELLPIKVESISGAPTKEQFIIDTATKIFVNEDVANLTHVRALKCIAAAETLYTALKARRYL